MMFGIAFMFGGFWLQVYFKKQYNATEPGFHRADKQSLPWDPDKKNILHAMAEHRRARRRFVRWPGKRRS